MKLLSGKKTYVAAGLLVLYAVLGLVTGKLEDVQSVGIILEALAIAGLRAGIAGK